MIEMEISEEKNKIIFNALEKSQNSNILTVDVFPIVTISNSFITYNWIFTGSTDAEAETPICWPPDVKGQLIGKDPDVGKIEGRRRGQQRMKLLDGITISNGPEFEHSLRGGEAWHAAAAKIQTWVNYRPATASADFPEDS